MQVPTEARKGVKSPGAGDTGDYDSPKWVPGTKFMSSKRTINILNCGSISPDPTN